jgi:hypothetical protein
MPFPPDTAEPLAPARGPIDFSRTFKFVFEDPDWVKKILIGGVFLLLSVLLVGTFFAMGYVMRLIQRATRGEVFPLPEWDDLGGLFGEGVKAVGLYLVYVLPPALALAFLAVAGALLTGGLGAQSQEAGQAVGALFGLGFFAMYGLFWLVMLALMFYMPAPLTRLALSGDFRAGLDFRENIAYIKRNLSNYVLALTFYLLASFIAQFGVLLCCIGLFPVSFWSLCVLGFALGETARRDPAL